MAIADTITSMQNHTSNAYTMIGYGIDLTGINKNLENLSKSIFKAFIESLNNPDTLWGNLPKITGSGSNITLNDTANAPMRIELGASELTQAGTPTPSSPQDIHSISGSNKVVVCGKNLFNPEKAVKDSNNSDTYITSDGNWIRYKTGASRLYFYPMGIKENTQYTFSAIVKNDTSSSNYITMSAFYTDGTNAQIIASNITDTNEHNIIGTTSSGKTLSYIRTGNTDGKITYMKIDGTQLVEGNYTLSTIPSYTPYISQEADIDLDTLEYCKIGNYEDKFIRSSDGTWQLEKNIGKVVLDGTENWIFGGSSTTPSNRTVALIIFPTFNTDYKSNYFIKDSSTSNRIVLTGGSGGGLYISLDDNITGIESSDTDTQKLQKIKDWITVHNTIVYYILLTPTYTPITGTLAEQLENVYKNMLSQASQTNISQENDGLPFELDVSALENIGG